MVGFNETIQSEKKSFSFEEILIKKTQKTAFTFYANDVGILVCGLNDRRITTYQFLNLEFFFIIYV